MLEALAREAEPRAAARAAAQPRRGSSSAASRPRSAARRPATSAAGATPASASRWSAPPDEPAPLLARFADLPQIVALIERAERRALGVTVEGVPVELVAAEPAGSARPCARDRLGRVRRRARAASRRARGGGRLPRLGIPFCPPELREAPFRGEPPPLVDRATIRGDLHCHTTWSDGRASVEEMGRAARDRGYEYLAICDHTPAVGAVRGLTPDDVRRQGEEIAAANEALAPFRVLRGIECDILPDGRLDLPDDVLAELDWVQASVHGGQRMPRREMTSASRPRCATRT